MAASGRPLTYLPLTLSSHLAHGSFRTARSTPTPTPAYLNL